MRNVAISGSGATKLGFYASALCPSLSLHFTLATTIDRFLQAIMQTSRASNIPPELFPRILHHVVFARPGLFLVSSLTQPEKKAIARVALVCRYWADQCRPWLFERLVLRSAADVRQLRGFVDLPAHPRTTSNRVLRRMENLVQTILLVTDEADVPWAHLIPPLLSALVSVRFCELSISGRNAHATPTHMPSIHRYLPRIVPALFSPFTELTLSDLCFTTANDLFRLVAELTKLSTLSLHNVTCELHPQSAHVHFPAALREVSVSGAHSMLPWIVPALLVRQPRGRTARRASAKIVSEDEHDILKDIIHAMRGSETADLQWKAQTVRFDGMRKYQRSSDSSAFFLSDKPITYV